MIARAADGTSVRAAATVSRGGAAAGATFVPAAAQVVTEKQEYASRASAIFGCGMTPSLGGGRAPLATRDAGAGPWPDRIRGLRGYRQASITP